MAKGKDKRERAFTFDRGGSTYSLDPIKDTVIIGLDTKDGREHPYYDDRIKLPLKESFVHTVAWLGILEPIIIRRDGEKAVVMAGRQRVRAARLVNDRRRGRVAIPDDLPEEWKARYDSELPDIMIPAVIRRAPDAEAQIVQIVENEARIQDTPLTRAHKMKKMVDAGHSQVLIASAFNCSQASVSMTLQLLDASDSVQKAIEDGVLSATAAQALVDLPLEEQDRRIAEARALGVTISISTVQKERAAREVVRSGPKPPARGVVKKLSLNEDFTGGLSNDAKALLAWLASGDDSHVRRVPGLTKVLRELTPES